MFKFLKIGVFVWKPCILPITSLNHMSFWEASWRHACYLGSYLQEVHKRGPRPGLVLHEGQLQRRTHRRPRFVFRGENSKRSRYMANIDVRHGGRILTSGIKVRFPPYFGQKSLFSLWVFTLNEIRDWWMVNFNYKVYIYWSVEKYHIFFLTCKLCGRN